MKRIQTVVLAVLVAGVGLHGLHAQGAASELRSSMQPKPTLPKLIYAEDRSLDDFERSLAAYRPNHWRTGALVGAAVGVALGTIVLTTCDRDSNQDCPGWGRAAIAFAGSTGLGALIGALIPAGPPEPKSGYSSQ